jgi:hypothetical protein
MNEVDNERAEFYQNHSNSFYNIDVSNLIMGRTGEHSQLLNGAQIIKPVPSEPQNRK